jgi:hypothetical protein
MKGHVDMTVLITYPSLARAVGECIFRAESSTCFNDETQERRFKCL